MRRQCCWVSLSVWESVAVKQYLEWCESDTKKTEHGVLCITQMHIINKTHCRLNSNQVRVHLKCSNKTKFTNECVRSVLTFYELNFHNKAEADVCAGMHVCVCICMYVYYLTDPDSCLIVDGFFPPNTGSASKQPPPFPDSHAATFLTLLPCFPFSLLTSAIFHFPLRVCVWEREREREVDRGSGCSGSLPRSKKRLSLTLSSRTCSSSTAHYVRKSVSLDTNFFTGKKKRWDEMNDELKTL